MGFKLKSGNTTSFKNMGGTEQSPAKDKPVLTHDHDYGKERGEKQSPAKDMKTGSYEQSFESPAKQKYTVTDARPQDVIDKEKETIKNEDEAKKKAQEKIDQQIKGTYVETNEDVQRMKDRERTNNVKPKSPAKQTKDTFKDGSKKSARDKFNDKETAAEIEKNGGRDNQKMPKPNFKIHSKEVDLNKKSGFGPIAKNANLTRKQKATSKAEMKGIDSKSPYWYKINGKTVSKNQYLNYENKPGGDEPGKQTNHPDVYGRIKNNHGRGPKTK